MLIIWNLDCTNYSIEQLEKLYNVVEQIDFSIAKQIDEYIESNKSKE